MVQRVVLVTGASRGIGAAVVAQLVQQQDVHVIAVSRTPLPSTNNVTAVQGDVTDDAVRKRAVQTAVASFGRIDAVINNAGVLDPLERLATAPADAIKQAFDVNVVAAIALVQEALPHLIKTNGVVVNVSSGAAVKAYEGWGAYCCTKAALNMFTSVLAKEEPAISAIALRPGVVDTAMQAQIRSDVGQKAMGADHAKFPQLFESGQLLVPELPAKAIAHLALLGSGAKSLSGQFIQWDEVKLT